jgi:hypothetical protein
MQSKKVTDEGSIEIGLSRDKRVHKSCLFLTGDSVLAVRVVSLDRFRPVCLLLTLLC